MKAGAFDSFGHPRKGLVLIHEQAVDSVIDLKHNEAIGQDSLFGGDEQAEAAFEVAIPDTEWDKKTRLNFEREMLGLYVSDHPLLGIEHIIANGTDTSVAELMAVSEDGDDEEVDRPAFPPGGPQRRPDRQDRRHPVRRDPQGHSRKSTLSRGSAGGAAVGGTTSSTPRHRRRHDRHRQGQGEDHGHPPR